MRKSEKKQKRPENKVHPRYVTFAPDGAERSTI